MRRAALCALLALASGASAQTPDADGVYDIADEPAALIGGFEGLAARVEYPEMARRAGIEGRVPIEFIVDERGTPTAARATRCPNALLCEAAIQAIQQSRFTVPRVGGVPVRARYALPIDFALRDTPAPEAASPEAASPEAAFSGIALGASGDVREAVEQPPEVVGGLSAFQSRLEYPEFARRAGVEGRVYVRFIVHTDGRVSDASCVQSDHDILCEAAIRAVESTAFHPGREQGWPVAAWHTLPAVFKLR